MTLAIVLNGTSSSGKTTLAEALRGVLTSPVQISGIDTFLALQPESMFAPPGAPTASDGFTWSPVTVDGVAAWNVTPGPLGEAFTRAVHQFWAATASEGISQIIDHVTLSTAMASDLQRRLAPYDPLYVAVRCPLNVIDQRERDRGDRLIGQGRGIGSHVHNYLSYDIEIDASVTQPGDAAQAIAAHLTRIDRRSVPPGVPPAS